MVRSIKLPTQSDQGASREGALPALACDKVPVLKILEHIIGVKVRETTAEIKMATAKVIANS
jgi:hypothetical protein